MSSDLERLLDAWGRRAAHGKAPHGGHAPGAVLARVRSTRQRRALARAGVVALSAAALLAGAVWIATIVMTAGQAVPAPAAAPAEEPIPRAIDR
ncbi:MAG: hypothetical protein SFZ24_07700 [Planctomycetota bacterium]|nr:hypothetical protein [Planctomycetota bacterium]